MIVGRIIGWLLIIGGAAVAVQDALNWLETGTIRLVALGEFWFDRHPPSLNTMQSLIQRYTVPELWDPGIVTVLLLPAGVLLGASGLVITFLCRRRKRRYRLMD